MNIILPPFRRAPARNDAAVLPQSIFIIPFISGSTALGQGSWREVVIPTVRWRGLPPSLVGGCAYVSIVSLGDHVGDTIRHYPSLVFGWRCSISC